MRVLLAVLLVAGTGVADDGPSSFDEGTTPVQVRTDAIGSTDDPPAASGDASAVAALKKLGARIKQDDQGNVVELNLSRSKITDAGLLHLKGLTGLQTLSLYRTQTTDVGLVHLKGLTKLQSLNLQLTKITDAGLAHLKGLANLETLSLQLTKITDAGLVHLKGLTGLQVLYVSNTKVTDAGVAELQKTLPDCRIRK